MAEQLTPPPPAPLISLVAGRQGLSWRKRQRQREAGLGEGEETKARAPPTPSPGGGGAKGGSSSGGPVARKQGQGRTRPGAMQEWHWVEWPLATAAQKACVTAWPWKESGPHPGVEAQLGPGVAQLQGALFTGDTT